MRITGSRMLELAAQATSRAQSAVADLSHQLSSGHRVERPSDDPLAWAQARRAAVRQAASAGRGEALGLGHDHLVDTERALTTIGGVLSESRQLAVQAANASYSAVDRAALADHVAGLLQVALAAANSKTTAGEYLLGGSLGTAEPFDAAGVYQGDAATRSLEIDEGALSPASLSGASLTAAEGVDVLPALGRLVTALAANDLAAVQAAVGELGAAHAQVTEARGQVGSMRAVIDEADQLRGQLEDTLVARVAELTDTDVITAASELARRGGALTAAQAVNAKLAQLLSPGR